jgi:hypothetical protein
MVISKRDTREWVCLGYTVVLSRLLHLSCPEHQIRAKRGSKELFSDHM